MSSEIEVIPTVPLSWDVLKAKSGNPIEIHENVEGFAYQIAFRSKIFQLLKMDSRKDFEVHSPIEFLDEKRSDLVDIENLARGWGRVGFSYCITPEGAYEDSDFVDFVALIAEATQGNILNIQGIWSWSSGLSTPQELMERSAVLR